jgi:GNAT superfamily N-acetyltransferase
VSLRVERVLSSRSPEFQIAYASLHAEFGARGELERREVLAGWVDEPKPASAAGLDRTYHLLVVRSEQGELAAVRDCHVTVSRASATMVVYLAHALVMPAFRRTGIGSLLRRLPVQLAEDELRRAGLDAPEVDVLLAAEMEPLEAENEASMTRLIAYGRDGFAALDSAAFPYSQPDFRELRSARELETAVPLPLLAVVRWVGHDSAARLPKPLARAFVEHLYAVFASHVHPDQLVALKQRTLLRLDASPHEEVVLFPLPRSIEDRERLAPLQRARVLTNHGGRP